MPTPALANTAKWIILDAAEFAINNLGESRSCALGKAIMIRSISISGFRCFPDFEMSQLGRVNLLVGKNNCGKTTILEAIQLLSSGGDPHSLGEILDRRGERFQEKEDRARRSRDFFDVSHLFHDHAFDVGSQFSLRSRDDSGGQWVELTVSEKPADSEGRQRHLFDDTELISRDPLDDAELASPLSIVLRWSLTGENRQLRLPVNPWGGLTLDRIRWTSRPSGSAPQPVRFVPSDSLPANEVIPLLEDVILTAEEELVIGALGTIEEGIERIAPVGSSVRDYPYERWRSARPAVVVKCRGQRMPIGSLGDGIWRMLGLSLSLVGAKGGVLLVDEIDSGLHYSVMSDMWKLVYQTALRLNVQVFATTHSLDCIESLAAVCRQGDVDDVTMQRVERGRDTAVAFSEEEIIAAAERRIEIR